MNAVIYTRVSATGQEENYSLDTQLDRCRAYAQSQGWTVLVEYREAYSAGVLDRPRLNELRDLVRAGGCGVVLAYAQDRLSRSRTDTAILLGECIRAGVALCTVLEGPFEATAIGKMPRNNLASAGGDRWTLEIAPDVSAAISPRSSSASMASH